MERYFYHPDDVVFHADSNTGFTFAQARALTKYEKYQDQTSYFFI